MSAIDLISSDFTTTTDDDALSTDISPSMSTDIDPLDHTTDLDSVNTLPTTTPSDIAFSTDHVISTQPISTDREDAMSTTTDVQIDVTQTDITDTVGDTTEMDDLLVTTAVDEGEATTPPNPNDHDSTVSTTTNGILIDVTQTDSTDRAETTGDDLLLSTDEVNTSGTFGSDITQPEVSDAEDVNDVTADRGEGLGAAGPNEATAGAMVISATTGLVTAIAFANLKLIIM